MVLSGALHDRTQNDRAQDERTRHQNTQRQKTKEDSAVTHTDEPRSGSKGILSFAAAGLTLAVGITAWTWNSAVSNTSANPDEMSTSATSQLASDQASRSTATSTSSKATRSTSAPAPEQGQDGGGHGSPADPTEKIDALARGGNLAPLGNDPLLPPDTWRGGYQAPSPQHTVVEDAVPTETSPKSLPNQPQIPGMNFPPLPTEWPSKLPGVPGKPPSKGDPKPSNPTTPKPGKPGVQDGTTTTPGAGEADPGQQPDRPNTGSSDSGQGGTPAPSTKTNKNTKTDGEGADKKSDSQPEATPTPEPKPRPGR